MMHIEIYAGDKWNAALIVPVKTGVIWSLQTGGVACHHPEVEGFVIPCWVGDDFPHLGCWGEFGGDGSDDRGVINAQFKSVDLPVRIDEARWDQAEEAWWPVIVTERERLSEIYWSKSLKDRACWLTTENCD